MEDSNTQSHWYDKTWLVIVLCVVFFPVGLYALWKNKSINIGWKIAVSMAFTFIVLGQLGFDGENEKSDTKNRKTRSQALTELPPEEVKRVGIGEVLETEYFDIIVQKVSVEEAVYTGNEFADLSPEYGTLYLIITASFRNSDTKSRMLFDGSVWINFDGQDYKFDKSETIMLDGWGLFLDQINPLTVKTTNLVYKIPEEARGPMYWQPGRANKSQRIYLGDLQYAGDLP